MKTGEILLLCKAYNGRVVMQWLTETVSRAAGFLYTSNCLHISILQFMHGWCTSCIPLKDVVLQPILIIAIPLVFGLLGFSKFLALARR